jgi:hypothetical protein
LFFPSLPPTILLILFDLLHSKLELNRYQATILVSKANDSNHSTIKMVPPKEKKNRKNNPNHDANGKNQSRSKKKSKSNMHEKQEEDKNRTFEDLDSSPAWSQEISEAKGIDEAEDVVETPEDPVEVSRTAEQTNNVVAAEQVNAELLQEELSGSKRVANETELPPTTSEHEPDSGDVSSDTNAKNQASINPGSSDGGEVVDIADSKGHLGDGHQESSFQAQVSQKAVEVTKGDNVREEVVVSTEDTVPCAELKDEAASGRHCGSVPSTQPEPHQQPSPVPSKQLLAGLETATEDQISESQASIDQEPKHYDQPASPLQGVQEEQTTRPAPADLQLGSAPVTTSRDENTQTPKPVTRDQTTQTSKPSTRDRGTQTPMVTTRDQGTQTPTVTTRDQGTQTEEVWIDHQPRGRSFRVDQHRHLATYSKCPAIRHHLQLGRRSRRTRSQVESRNRSFVALPSRRSRRTRILVRIRHNQRKRD